MRLRDVIDIRVTDTQIVTGLFRRNQLEVQHKHVAYRLIYMNSFSQSWCIGTDWPEQKM